MNKIRQNIFVLLLAGVSLISNVSAQIIPDINCDGSSFYAVTTNNEIHEMTFINDSTVTASYLMPSSGSSLSIGNSLANGITGITFQSKYVDSLQIITNYDGTSWVNDTLQMTAAPPILNFGANQTYFYSQVLGVNRSIQRYDGTSVATIYTTTNSFGGADLAVDDFGNVWFLSAIMGGGITSDFLFVIDPSGNYLETHPFELDMNHCYGTMIFDNGYYLAFGSSSPLYPHKMIRVNIASGTPVIDKVINMPANNYSDLASCYQGDPRTLDTKELSDDSFTIYPNPFDSELEIKHDFNEDFTAELRDVNGSLIDTYMIHKSQQKISLPELQSGVYFLSINLYDKSIVKKLIKL